MYATYQHHNTKRFKMPIDDIMGTVSMLFSGYASLRPFLDFDLYFGSLTSQSLLRILYLGSRFLQIWTSYWSSSTGRSTVLVEVKRSKESFAKKSELKLGRIKISVEVQSVGRSTEKDELKRSIFGIFRHARIRNCRALAQSYKN